MRTVCDNKFKCFFLLGVMSFMAGCADDSTLVSDFCPDDAEKTAPGICGCGVSDIDSDSDDTPDCMDGCPNDANKVVPGICGCGNDDALDANQNHIPDCIEGDVDLCPEDQAKTQPGLCGCGVSDDDSDKDGVPDCLDKCAKDPKKTSEGVCGCDVEDSRENLSDNDGDGLVNCIDPCPDNPDLECKFEDTDGDGFSNDDDTCPYNPNVHEAKDDCNYVTQSDGKRVFEIWSAHDLDRLRTELNRQIPDGNVGMTCQKEGITGCQDEGNSPNYYRCVKSNNHIVGRITKETCESGDACVREASANFICKEIGCRQTETPSQEGDCCSSEDFRAQCSSDGLALLRCIDGMVRVWYTCQYGCTTDEDGGVTCNDVCVGDNKLEGGEVNDCCDERQYVSTCRDDGTLLVCEKGVVHARTCDAGCEPGKEEIQDDGEIIKTSAMCKGCDDNASADGLGACCDEDTYQAQCSSSSTLKTCVGGIVVEKTCSDSCYSYQDGFGTRCEDSVIPNDLFEVRMMKDIDLADVLEQQYVAKRCGGLWESLPLYRTHFDGNGKTIRFSAQDRCAMVAPLFSEIVESSVESLKLDYDMVGAAPAALTIAAADSEFHDIDWMGTWDKTSALLGEKGYAFSGTDASVVFASVADHCRFDQLHYAGNIYADESFYGFFGNVSNSVITNISGTPEQIVCRTGSCHAAFLNVDRQTLVKGLELDIPHISAGQTWEVLGQGNGPLDTVKVQIGDIVLSDPDASGQSITLFSSNETKKLYHLELNVDRVDAAGAGTSIVNSSQGDSKDWQIHLGHITTTTFVGMVLTNKDNLSDIVVELDRLDLVHNERGEGYPVFYGILGIVDSTSHLNHATIKLGTIMGIDERKDVQDLSHAPCALGFLDVEGEVSGLTLTVEEAKCGDVYGISAFVGNNAKLSQVNFEAKKLLAVSNVYIVTESINSKDEALKQSAFYTEKAIGDRVFVINNLSNDASISDVALYGNYYSLYQNEPDGNDESYRFSNGFVTYIDEDSMVSINNVVSTSHFYKFTERDSQFEPKDAVVSYEFPMMYGYSNNDSDYHIMLDGNRRYYLRENEKARAAYLDQIDTLFMPYQYSDVTQIIRNLGGNAAGWITRDVSGNSIPWRSFNTATE